jgi:hypothetical protein
MPIYYINTGTGANAGNGDTLRTAFNKINANMSYLYSVTFSQGFLTSSTVNDYVWKLTNSSGSANIFVDHSGTTQTWSFNQDGTTSFPNYAFTNTTGTGNQVLVNDGIGMLVWQDQTGLGSGWELTSGTNKVSLQTIPNTTSSVFDISSSTYLSWINTSTVNKKVAYGVIYDKVILYVSRRSNS